MPAKAFMTAKMADYASNNVPTLPEAEKLSKRQ